MTQPLFFDPDPSIPDSDLLGYGNLLFDNGSSQWINGDPDIASGYPRMPERTGTTDVANPLDRAGLQDPNTGELYQQPDPMMNPVAPVAKIGSAFADTLNGTPPPGQQGPLNPSAGGLQPTPIPGTDHALDSQGQIVPAASIQQQPGQGAAPGGGLQPTPIPGTDHALDSQGQIVPKEQAGFGTGGLQLASREGALPRDVATQQRQQREQGDLAEQQAMGFSRMQELHAYRMANAQQAGVLDAQKKAQEDAVAEQQAKQKRLNDERDLLNNTDIKTDLVSAEGGVGAVLSIVGAALLGFVHSDAGLRMIDNTIDQNVKKQLGMRDSKLRAIADQLGSTDQAIAAGKAQLYKIAADKAELTQKILTADVYEAQGPAVYAALRQRQQQYDQEQDRISLGKTLEKAPVSTVNPEMVEKYGKAAAGQERQTSAAQQALRLVGGIYDPQTGTITNAKEILKEGIPGVGKADSFLQAVPGLKNLDTLMTSDKGIALRAALESMVGEKALEMNGGRQPAEGDTMRARKALGLDTEEGVLKAIASELAHQQTAKEQNVATYGPGAAATYEGRRDALEPGRSQGMTSPGAVNIAQPGSARQMLEQDRARQPATGPQSSVTPMQNVAGEVQAVAGRELPPEGLKILVAQAAHETSDGQHAPGNNFFGIKGKGNNLETTEGEGANARRVRSDFRAYGSPTESVTDLVSLLQRKYPDAWRALQIGDAPAYVAALKDGGYFTGSETEYLNGIQRRL